MFVPKNKPSHVHDFEDIETAVPVRRVVNEDGKNIMDTMTAKDILKQRKCKCGKIETYDMKRIVV